MKNAYDVLKERGFIEQMTHEEEIRELFSKGEPVTFYIGFDPTADSLHVGHFLTVMAMAHMQRCGHRPICLMGGGTGMIGDPTGKTDMRRMMTIEEILAGESKNVEFKESLPEKNIKYMKSVVAFANGTGGKIIFGIADKTREVVGFDKEDVFKEMDAIANAVSDSCEPAIIPDITYRPLMARRLLL